MNPKVPLQLGVQLYHPYFPATPNTPISVYGRVNIWLAQSADISAGLLDIAYVLDISGSMSSDIHTLVESTINSFEALPSGSNLSVVTFDDRSYVVSPLVSIDQQKAQVTMAVETIRAGNLTYMSRGMEEGLNQLRQSKNPKKVMVLFADGATAYDDVGSCKFWTSKAEEEGVTIFTFGFSRPIADARDMQLMKEIGDNGNNFEFFESPDKIGEVFNEKIVGIAKTAITNSRLVIKPTTWWPQLQGQAKDEKENQVVEGCLALPEYKPSQNPLDITVGDIQVETTTAALVKFTATLRPDVQPSKSRSFANLTLVGDIDALGVKQQELGSANIVLRFSANPVEIDEINHATDQLIQQVAIAKDLKGVEVAQTPEEAKKLIDRARRKTRALAGDVDVSAIESAINDIDSNIDQGKLDRAQAKAGQAGRKTRAFVAADDDLSNI